jgi:hypothetical protein
MILSDIIVLSVVGILGLVAFYFMVHRPMMNSDSCDTPWGWW